MQSAPIQFGRTVQSVGPLLLPLSMAEDSRNVDRASDGVIRRRRGLQHALTSQMQGAISFIAGYDDYDGTDVFIVVDESGVRRET